MFVEPRPWDTFAFERGGRKARVRLTPAFTSNSGDVLRELAIAGIGVLPTPSFLVDGAVREGRLEPLLREWTVVGRPKVWAIYAHRRFLPAKVRLFVEALREAFRGDPARGPWLPV